MEKTRLELFTDAVLAIIITIMVLHLNIPQGSDISDLYPQIPIFLSYVLSFTTVGIYWTNHHHLLQATNKISGKILGINLIMLFWLSLFPFTTTWMAGNYLDSWPTALYGIVVLMAGISYVTLQNQIIKNEGENSKLKQAIGKDYIGKLSLIGYIIANCFALISPQISQLLYGAIVLFWLKPDQRIEEILN